MATKKWVFDRAHSSINFSVRHMVVSRVRGRFLRWDGTLTIDDVHHEDSSVDVRMEAASIDTAEPTRDGHLRSEDFLYAEKFPYLTFKSTRIDRKSERESAVLGELTIRGITRPLVLEVKCSGTVCDPEGNDRKGFFAKTSIDRRDFGITLNTALDVGGFVLGDRVDIELEIQVVRPGAHATVQGESPNESKNESIVQPAQG